MSASPSLEFQAEESPVCRVCQVIMSDFQRRQRNFCHKLGTVAEVMDMDCPHAEWIRGWWVHGKPNGADKAELRGVVACGSFNEPTVEIEFFLDSVIRIRKTCDLVVQTDELGHVGTTRILPRWANPSVFRSWYSRCLDEHGSRCHKPSWTEFQTGKTECPKWLVDVDELCVVPFSPATTRYLTLSYTWGQVQCLRTTVKNLENLKNSGCLHPDQSPAIPQTVFDAIKTTQVLGERYLWVDSLCIIQDDHAALYRDLKAMHLIYSNSILCLVALAGTHANYGLRGVEGVLAAPRSLEQEILEMSGGHRLSYFKNPQQQREKGLWSKNSHLSRDISVPETLEAGTGYNERGWTFQEFAFARRRPLRWVCQRATWGEEQVDQILGLDPLVWMPSTDWMKTRGLSLAGTVGTAALQFNRRQFNFQRDVLRAFLGIQNYLGGLLLGGLILD